MILCLLLALATVVVYNAVVHNGFINLDDNGYLIDNTHVHAGLTPATVKWAFTTYDCENWHPLTWLSHALDWELFGKNTAGHHYMSVLFHALNAVLLFLLLERATGFPWRSFVVAALFALHPVNVESVAWAAERKNVLSMVFFLLAMIAYGWYAERRSVKRYSWVLVLFALGLMAKPQVITLPCVLLLWDYWPLQRFGSREDGVSRYARASFGSLVLEKVPLFVLAAADALITMRAQHKAVSSAMAYTFRARLENAVVAYTRYIGHAFWPFRLSPAYPHPGNTIPLWPSLSAGAFLILVTVFVLAARKRYLIVGWLWFLGIMVPMIGIVQVGDQAMADRYAYIPYIGLFWIATWSIAEFGKDWQISNRWVAIPACAVIVGSGALTVRQVSYWHDSETLWRYALSLNDNNFMAHSYLAGILTLENRHEEAIAEYIKAENLHTYPLTQVVYFADYELRHSHVAGAMADAERVVQGTNDPSAREMAFRVLGIGYTQLGKPAEAREEYRQALQIEPRDPYALMGLGLLSYREHDFSTAAQYFSRTVDADPSDFDYLLLATALKQSGEQDKADAAFANAQRVSKNWSEAQDKAHWFLAN
ncbi:MAG TPA: tetratricopeptide repeat protein [Candidatus Sulfotelmatobacter sp.]|nr:tetratricopeptide repeat protein [Candidatus Sulfotelmatobacter sp.]